MHPPVFGDCLRLLISSFQGSTESAVCAAMRAVASNCVANPNTPAHSTNCPLAAELVRTAHFGSAMGALPLTRRRSAVRARTGLPFVSMSCATRIFLRAISYLCFPTCVSFSCWARRDSRGRRRIGTPNSNGLNEVGGPKPSRTTVPGCTGRGGARLQGEASFRPRWC